MEVAVRCRNVTKVFGQGGTATFALHGIDLDAAFGELLLLVGPSGCGKTTLLSVIAGILTPTAGEIVVLGEDLARLRGNRLVKFRGRNIGFVFQQFNLLPSLTALENVAVPLLIRGVPRGEALRRARPILERMRMGHRLEMFPRSLSGGEQQRTAIARALVHEPRLLVCDEPTSALDAETGRTIMKLLRETALGAERAVLVVTHDSRIFEFGDRIARMDDGRVAEILPGRTAARESEHFTEGTGGPLSEPGRSVT